MRPCPQKAERNKTMNRREFLANALKLSALGVLPVSLFGEPERPELFRAGKTTIGRRSFRGFSLPLLGLGLMNLPQCIVRNGLLRKGKTVCATPSFVSKPFISI